MSKGRKGSLAALSTRAALSAEYELNHVSFDIAADEERGHEESVKAAKFERQGMLTMAKALGLLCHCGGFAAKETAARDYCACGRTPKELLQRMNQYRIGALPLTMRRR